MHMSPGNWNVYRARNLAACGHFSEALEELNVAIGHYDNAQSLKHSPTLDPDWLIMRAQLFQKLGDDDKALADVRRAAGLKRAFDIPKYRCACFLIEYGKYGEAQTLLKQLSEKGMTLFRCYYLYLLGYSLEKDGKRSEAGASYMEAARLFAASGFTGASQVAIDSYNRLRSASVKALRFADLKAPDGNEGNIERLFKALVSRKDVLEPEVLKGFVGAGTMKETRLSFIIVPYKGHYPELSLVTINKLKTGGRHLLINFDTRLCCLDISKFASYLKNDLGQENRWRKGYASTRKYKVPAGTLIVSRLDGGFKSVMRVDLYSNDAQYPQKRVVHQNSSGVGLSPSQQRLHKLLNLSQHNRLNESKDLIDDWVKDEPDCAKAHMWNAAYLADKGDYVGALKAIDVALKFGDGDTSLNSRYTGNVLLIRKGTYLLELGRYEEALNVLEKGFPEKLHPEHHLLAARAEIGVGKFEEARADLGAAETEFFSASRIVKRDQCRQLLKSIEGKENKSLDSNKETVKSSNCQDDSSERSVGSITFPCVLHAFSKLSLTGNFLTGSIDSRELKSSRSYLPSKRSHGDVSCSGDINISGNALVFGTIYGDLPKNRPPQIDTWRKVGSLKIKKKPLEIPQKLSLAKSKERINLGEYKSGQALVAGDYDASSVDGGVGLAYGLKKPVRIFLNDENTKSEFVLNLRSAGYDRRRPEALQIWYMGKRKIKFVHNSNICAIIYAPNAPVEMGDNNCSFTGAIVADSINAIGNVSAYYDLALADMSFTPSKPSKTLGIPEGMQMTNAKRHSRMRELKEASVQRIGPKRPSKFDLKKQARETKLKKLLTKYPALSELDVIDGKVEYVEPGRENTGSRGGGISDGKPISIRGPNSIVVLGNGDGSHRIILDGLRLVDIAARELKQNKLNRAEDVATAAVRANPNSEAFALIGQIWYRRKKLESAWQACSMALDLDGNNKEAMNLKVRLDRVLKKK